MKFDVYGVLTTKLNQFVLQNAFKSRKNKGALLRILTEYQNDTHFP